MVRPIRPPSQPPPTHPHLPYGPANPVPSHPTPTPAFDRSRPPQADFPRGMRCGQMGRDEWAFRPPNRAGVSPHHHGRVGPQPMATLGERLLVRPLYI